MSFTIMSCHEEGPFPGFKSLIHAHWTSIYWHLDDQIKTLVLHLTFFCNLISRRLMKLEMMSQKSESELVLVVQVSKITAMTALVKLLPPVGF